MNNFLMIIIRSDIEIVCRCPYGAGLSGTGGCPETRGACRRCGSDADAAGDGDRDFGEREVTAGIPAGRKGSKGRMWIPEDGAPGDGWRG